MANLDISTDERGVTRLAPRSPPSGTSALDRVLIDALHAMLSRLNSNTRVLVLEGRGRSFCAGADIDWMRRLGRAHRPGGGTRPTRWRCRTCSTRSTPCPCRRSRACNGAAIGGGAGLVACCDVAVASERARFAFSEVRLGLIPATIGPYVVRAIGPRAAPAALPRRRALRCTRGLPHRARPRRLFRGQPRSPSHRTSRLAARRRAERAGGRQAADRRRRRAPRRRGASPRRRAAPG